MRKLFLLACLACLVGCNTPKEINAENEIPPVQILHETMNSKVGRLDDPKYGNVCYLYAVSGSVAISCVKN